MPRGGCGEPLVLLCASDNRYLVHAHFTGGCVNEGMLVWGSGWMTLSEADPDVVARLLSHYENLNVTPHRVVAEFSSGGLVHIQIHVSGLSESRKPD